MPSKSESIHNLKNEIEKLHHINQLILDSVAEGIYGIDLNANVILWNKAAQELTGYSMEDFENANLHDLIHHTNTKGDHVPLEDCPVYHALNNGSSLFVEDDIFWHKSGQSFPVEYTIKPMIENEEHVGTVITFRDISEKKQTEEMMKEWEKLTLVGQMSAGIAHEIRNPITSLKGFVQLIKNNREYKEEYFTIIDSEFDRMESIIKELLTFSKQQKSNYQKHDLIKLIEHVVLLMEPQATLRNINVTYDFQIPQLHITCIEHQIKQVLVNILKNSLEAISEAGHIEVKVSQQNDYAVIQVTDDGPGMSKEQIEQIGNPFFSTKESGTGLGMMVTNNIVRNNHQGKIEIESKLQEGTAFTIQLPIELET